MLEDIRLDNVTKCDMSDAVLKLHPKLGVKLQNTILNLIDTASDTATDKAIKWMIEYIEAQHFHIASTICTNYETGASSHTSSPLKLSPKWQALKELTNPEK